MNRTTLWLAFCLSLLATSLWADDAPPLSAHDIRAGRQAEAQRGAAFSLDAFVGFYPRHDELKLGAALVLEDGQNLRPELQVADNVVGIGVGYKLPLKLLADALSISVGGGVSWDTVRHEWTGSVYLAHVVF